MLASDEARALLDSIDARSLIGRRDRALIATMVYSFARINAVLETKVRDHFAQGRRGWVRLHEKGGKQHDVPCHHNLEKYLDQYISGRHRDPPGRTFVPHGGGKTGRLTHNGMRQQDAYRMIQRRTVPPASTRTGCHLPPLFVAFVDLYLLRALSKRAYLL